MLDPGSVPGSARAQRLAAAGASTAHSTAAAAGVGSNPALGRPAPPASLRSSAWCRSQQGGVPLVTLGSAGAAGVNGVS